MKFGVTIPNNWGVEDPQQVLAMGPLAEELGYDSIWVMDHLFNNGYIRERLDDKPYYHPLATLSYLAATTRQVTLGTSVLVLPYHNPVELAKYTATLDHMSGGRVTLGVGVGAMTEEFAALGVPFRQRGALTNECIAVMKELWTKEEAEFHGEFVNFDKSWAHPKPVQKPHPPILMGGDGPTTFDRVLEYCDGWLPIAGRMGPGLTEKIFLARDNTIYHLYQSRYGINVLRTEEHLRAVLATAEDTRLLGVAHGSPLLEVRRVALTFRDRPVELRVSRVDTSAHDYHNTFGKSLPV